MNLPKPSAKSSRPVLTASIASFLALTSSAVAQNPRQWTGATNTSWNEPGNWAGGVLPGGGDDAIIDITPANIATISEDIVTGFRDIVVGSAQLTNGRLDHTAGVASNGNSNWIFVGTNGGTGTYNLANTSASGGTFTGFGLGSGTLNVGGSDPFNGRLHVGSRHDATGGTGTFNVNTTGTLKIGNDLIVGSRGGTGTFNMDAGTVTTNGWNFIGNGDGLSGASGTLRMSGGTFNNLGTRTFVGVFNAAGTMVMTGGVYNNLNTNGDTQFAIGSLNNDNATMASLTMSGGTINANRLFAIGGTEGFGGNGGFTGAGKGILTMNGDSALLNVTGEFWVGNLQNSVGIMNVSAGTVKVNSWIAVGRERSTGTLTLSGTGRIEKTGGGNFEVGGNFGTGVLNLDGGTLNTQNITRNGNGTGTVNFNGGLLQANQSNVAFMQNMSNAFVKAGGARIDTQQFDITIAQPLLTDSFSTGGGLTKLGSGELVLSSGSSYTGPTLISAGTLTLSDNGSINGSSIIAIDGNNAKLVTRSFTSVSPMVTLTNGTLDGTGSLDNVTVGDGTGGKITNGNGAATTLTIGTLTFNGAANFSARVDTPAVAALNVTNLTAGAVNPTGVVTIDALPSSGLWQNGQSYALIGYGSFAGNLANFQKGTIAGLSSRQTATLANTGTAIALNIAGDYPIWTGSVDGRWTTATIAEPKNWVLQTAQTTTDFITGDIVIFNDDAAGTTTLNISDANVNITSAAFENTTKNYTITSAGGFGITGGTIIKSGSGTLTIGTPNTHSGGTTLNAGQLNINHVSALGTGPVTIAGGTIDNITGASLTLAANNPQRWTGNVTFIGTNALNLGTGQVTLGTDSAEQTITLTNNSALPGSSLIVGGPITSASGGTPGNKTIAITGTGNVVLSGNLSRGAANGLIIENTLPGTLTLSGSASGVTLLRMNGGASSTVDLGSGNLTVANGGGDVLQSTTGGTLAASGGGTLIIGSPNADFGTAAGTMLTVAARLAGSAAVDFYSPNGTLGTIVLEAPNIHTGGVNVENTRVIIPATGSINADNVANSGQLNVGTFNGSQAILELNGGTINVTKNSAPASVVGTSNGAVGSFRVTGGVLNLASDLWVGDPGGSYGSFTMSGGTASVGNWLAVGRNGSGYLQMTGGTLNVTSANMVAASFAGANGPLNSSFGVINVQGGTLNITRGDIDGGLVVGETGVGQLSISGGGQVNLSGPLGVQFGRNANGIGVASLNGGELTTRVVQKGPGVGILNFNGGTLRAAGNANSNFLQGLTNAYVRQGGAIIDDNGLSITVAQPLLAPTGNGVNSIAVTGGTNYLGAPLVQITGNGTGATAVANIDAAGNLTGITITNPGVGYTTAAANLIGGGGFGATVDSVNLAPNVSGGFTKRGFGVTTLSGANTYTGPTVIEAGRLALTGSISGSPIIDVRSSAAFDVQGVVGGYTLGGTQTLLGSGVVTGNVAMAAGSKLEPGNAGTGTLFFESNLNVEAAVNGAQTGALRFELGAVASSDQISITFGTLAIGSGMLGFNDFSFSALAGLDVGVYTLFDSQVPIDGTLDGGNLSGVISGPYTGTLGLADGGNDLILTVVPEPGSALILLAGGTVLAGVRRVRRRS